MSTAQKPKQKPKQKSKQNARQEAPVGTNLVVLEGEVSTEPTIRELPSGDILVGFDVRVRPAEGPAQSLPVTWIGSDQDRKALLSKLELGKYCVVAGAMNRRFYQARAGGLQSRVDVRAERVVVDSPAKRRAAIARFLKATT